MTYRIHRSVMPDTVVFAVSGDMDAEHAARLQEFVANEAGRRIVFDLKEVTLVGQAAERFLANRWRAVMMGVNVPIAEVPGHG